jgi:hypothetical protein
MSHLLFAVVSCGGSPTMTPTTSHTVRARTRAKTPLWLEISADWWQGNSREHGSRPVRAGDAELTATRRRAVFV